MLSEDRILRITLFTILKTDKFLLVNQTSKIARAAELKTVIEQICIEIMNLRMWNIKFDKNLKAKNKLHKHHVAHILEKAK